VQLGNLPHQSQPQAHTAVLTLAVTRGSVEGLEDALAVLHPQQHTSVDGAGGLLDLLVLAWRRALRMKMRSSRRSRRASPRASTLPALADPGSPVALASPSDGVPSG